MNESVWLGFIFFSSAGNLLRWNNGGGAMVEETEKERNVERERERVRCQTFLGLEIGLECNK